MMRPAALLFAASLAALPAIGVPSGASAKDLGVRGATWAIAEPDLIAEIESRLLEMQRSGELARFEAAARERARRKLEGPEPVPGHCGGHAGTKPPVRPCHRRRARHPHGGRNPQPVGQVAGGLGLGVVRCPILTPQNRTPSMG